MANGTYFLYGDNNLKVANTMLNTISMNILEFSTMIYNNYNKLLNS